MANKYDWFSQYDTIQGGFYGYQPEVINKMTDELISQHPDEYKAAVDAGIIVPGNRSTRMGVNEGGDYQKFDTDNGALGHVNWDKLPKSTLPENLPKGYSFVPIGSDLAVDPWTMKPIEANTHGGVGEVYHDENYGDFQLRANREADPWFNLARSLVIGTVTGGIASFAAPGIAAAVGAGGNSLVTSAINYGLRAIPSLAMGADPANTLYSTLAKIGGAATGIPGASNAASIAYQLATNPPGKP